MPSETTIEWEGRTLRLSYTPRRCTVIDHVEIVATDRQPLPITDTGYLSHFFGPVDPSLDLDEVAAFVIEWLDEEAKSDAWQHHLLEARQLSLL